MERDDQSQSLTVTPASADTQAPVDASPGAAPSSDVATEAVDNPSSQTAIGPGEKIPTHSGLKRAMVALAVLMVLIIAGAVYWNMEKPLSPQPVAAGHATPTPSITPSSSPSPNVPTRLFDASANISGVSIGYVASLGDTVGLGNQLAPTANAASDSYTTALFYTKPVEGIPQVFEYNETTQKQTQLTTETAGGTASPVFSSTGQILSYQHLLTSNNTPCELVIDSLASHQLTRINPGGQICDTPIAWSPDGSKLLYTSVNNDLTAPNWAQTELYLYDVATKTSTQVVPPTGDNDVEDMAWHANNAIEVLFASHQSNGGTYSAQQIDLVNVNSLTVTPMTDISTSEISGVQSTPTEEYATTIGVPQQVEMAPVTAPTHTTDIPGTTGVGTFLLEYNPDGSALTGIVFTVGMPGNPGTFHIESVPPSGGTPIELYSPQTANSVVLLGWGDTYGSLIYLQYGSGEDEIHQLNLSTDTDTALVTGLTFIQ